ncbi:MAG: DUF3021 domain-containing protein [Oscillospiraceae bacterium]
MKTKIIARMINGFFIGIAIGQIISVLISLIAGKGDFIICAPEFTAFIGNEASAGAVQTLLCGIMGAGFAAASLIWENEELNIAVQSGICFAIYAVSLLPIAYFTNWMEHTLSGVLSYIGIYLAIYVIVWIARYLSIKRKIKAINSRMNN